MARYTVIGYRPDGVRTNHGFNEEVFTSEFRFDTMLTRDQATLLIAEYRTQSNAGRACQPDWGIYVLRDGQTIIHDGRPYQEGYAWPSYVAPGRERDKAEIIIAEARAMLAGELIGDLPAEARTAGRPGRNVELD
jgi:hypothetical protein